MIRHKLGIFDSRTWKVYAEFVDNRDVLAVTLHPPLKCYCTQSELETALAKLQSNFKIPVYFEIMPSSEYWCSNMDTLIDFPLLLDVSHINIWHRGNLETTKQTCLSLFRSHSIKEIHLSHNKGKRDSHDFIPSNIWFSNLIDDWQKKYLITYESLPIDYAKYQRLDKCKVR
ncbi:MAG: hypothetical protein ACFCAD_10235 [Pleurocapsa sp.]